VLIAGSDEEEKELHGWDGYPHSFYGVYTDASQTDNFNINANNTAGGISLPFIMAEMLPGYKITVFDLGGECNQPGGEIVIVGSRSGPSQDQIHGVQHGHSQVDGYARISVPYGSITFQVHVGTTSGGGGINFWQIVDSRSYDHPEAISDALSRMSEGYNVGIGTENYGASPGSASGKLHIATSSTEGNATLYLEQGDIDEEFVRFQGTSAAGSTNSLSTEAGVTATKAGAIRININGTDRWIRFYDDPD
jgi:hypothetical protein